MGIHYPDLNSQPMVEVLSLMASMHLEGLSGSRPMSQMPITISRNLRRLFIRLEQKMGREDGIGKCQAQPCRLYLPTPKGQESDHVRQEG
jgi:hypothetical protein